MAKAPASTIPADRLASYERLISTLPGVDRKGATMPYTAVNGHMFSFLTPPPLALAGPQSVLRNLEAGRV